MVHVEKISSVSDELFYALRRIFQENMHATKAIMFSLKYNKTWDDGQRGFYSDMVYDITRYWRLLWYVLDKEPSFDNNGLQQVLNAYHTIKREQKMLSKNLEKRLSFANKIRAVRESVPDWLDALCEKELGAKWDSVLPALNQKPELVLRVNTLKKTIDELADILQGESIQTYKSAYAPDALVVKNKTNVFRLGSFKEGLFEVQDPASQMVSHFLEPAPGMLVIDACAGEGSKTLHLASLMKNRGRIIAMDTQKWRLDELRKRAKRSGACNIETRCIDSSKSYKRLKGKADRLLLDVSCSGLGALRRNPDIRWKLAPTDLDRLRELQANLLSSYCNLLKKQGKMVYATCSILPSEGEKQIEKFLKQQGEAFKLVAEKRYWPDKDGSDGFYIAVLERK